MQSFYFGGSQCRTHSRKLPSFPIFINTAALPQGPPDVLKLTLIKYIDWIRKYTAISSFEPKSVLEG